MNKLVVAAIAAMFAFSVHASSDKSAAAAPQAPAAKQMSKEECDRAMADAKDEATKEKLRNENGCK